MAENKIQMSRLGEPGNQSLAGQLTAVPGEARIFVPPRFNRAEATSEIESDELVLVLEGGEQVVLKGFAPPPGDAGPPTMSVEGVEPGSDLALALSFEAGPAPIETAAGGDTGDRKGPAVASGGSQYHDNFGNLIGSLTKESVLGTDHGALHGSETLAQRTLQSRLDMAEERPFVDWTPPSPGAAQQVASEPSVTEPVQEAKSDSETAGAPVHPKEPEAVDESPVESPENGSPENESPVGEPPAAPQPVNHDPVAHDDSTSLDEDTVATIDVLANDLDPDGDGLAVIAVTQGAHGAVTINADNTLTYIPDSDFTGEDSFSYTVSDGKGGMDTGAMSITVKPVNDAPTTNDVSAAGSRYGVPIEVTLSGSDIDGTVQSFSLESLPDHGTLYTDAGLTMTAAIDVDYPATDEGLALYFLPDPNYTGNARFAYTAKDESGVADATSAIATVTSNAARIDLANYDQTDQGFRITARQIDRDGDLTDRSTDHVVWNANGLGVAGSTGSSAPDEQLGYDAAHGVSEELIVEFDHAIASATVSVTRLFASEGPGFEDGHWEVFKDGVSVGGGDFHADSGHAMSFTVDPGPGIGFDHLVFTANPYGGGQLGITNDSSDYLVHTIDFVYEDPTTASYEGSAEGVIVDLAAGLAGGGTAEGDSLVGVENVIGSQYADTLLGDGGANLLNGGAGADTLQGAHGDDVLVWDLDDTLIDGGSGNDTLRVARGEADLSAFGGTMQGIEIIDLMTDEGANVVTLSVADVLGTSDDGTLTIEGDSHDSVDAGAGWHTAGTTGGYHVYTQGAATLNIDMDITVNPDIV